LNLIQQGIHRLAPYVSADLLAAEAYGMHHLSAAVINAKRGRRDAALDHIAEAQRTAQHTGERPLNPFAFGPTNVMIWRLSVFVTLGDGGQALESTPEVNTDAISSNNRLAYYHMHRSRALLQSRQREADAVAALLTAERIAPQLVRISGEARAAVRTLVKRSRPGVGRDVRTLMEHVRFAD
jgi:hypothetical protein